MIPLPRMSLTGVADYLALAVGLTLGVAIFRSPMRQLEDAFKKKNGQ
jgi:hypothetical protein|tara:strand:- start:195 stop:335 length:141 start_codon:yes stop_codon:yes gene_type:complete